MYITIDIGGTNVRISSFTDLTPNSFIDKTIYKSKDLQDYDVSLK